MKDEPLREEDAQAINGRFVARYQIAFGFAGKVDEEKWAEIANWIKSNASGDFYISSFTPHDDQYARAYVIFENEADGILSYPI